jgi:hypothetical protein
MNCTTCKYGSKGNEGYFCDINILNGGQICNIAKDSVMLDCPCHSEIGSTKVEYRYGYTANDKDDSDDTCQYCHRIVNDPLNLITRKFLIDNTNKKKRICSICVSKYFNEGENAV